MSTEAETSPVLRTSDSAGLLERKITFWAVAVWALLCCSITNLPWQLDEFSQERQALASFHVVKDGRWFYQDAPRDREATKPPLIPWISAAAYGITRSWDVAWRLPSYLAALVLAILLFRDARSAFGPAAALIALAAFGLNMLSARLATLVRTDMALALIVYLLGRLIWSKIRFGERWTRSDRWLVFALVTAGLYIKGPIIYLFLLPGVAFFCWKMRDETAAPRLAWCGWWPWLAPLPIFLVWVVGGIVTQAGFYDQVVVHEFLGRLGTTEQRPHPPYYYAGHLARKFLPWSALLLVSTILLIRSTGQRWRSAWQKMSPETVWLTGWSLGCLLVMSFIPSKRLDRIFPIVPPLCLLLAAQFARGTANERSNRIIGRCCAAAVLIAFLVTGHYSISKVLYGYRDQRDALSQFGRDVRRQSAVNGWRYEAVTSHDGGMLLYLEKSRFLEIEEALAAWNSARVDALVMRANDADLLRPKMGPTNIALQTNAKRADKGRGYVLVTR